MSHIFISYSKRNKDYVYQLADFLQHKGFNIWIDRSDIEYGVDWWDAIVAGLRGAGASVVVMTPEAKASEWVKREVFLALDWKKPLFPLLLNGDNWELFVTTQYCKVALDQMPDDDFLTRLSNYVTPRGKGLDHTAKPTPPPPAAPTAKPIAPAPPLFDLDGAIAEFGRAYRATDWSQAQEVLGRVRASGLNPDPFDLNHFERLVQQAIEAEKRRREQEALEAERQRQYQRIVDFVDMFDKATVWDTLQRFWQTFPNYDPEQIAKRVRPQKKLSSHELLPQPFAWIKVPKGKVTLIEDYWEDQGYLRKGQQQTFDVEAFEIGKYPVTVAQYALFVEANGYGTQTYWTPAGWQWRTNNSITLPRLWEEPRWHQPDHPIVGVSWYEAMAYCQWLSALTGEAIHLPTEQQWQRAGQGDDGRLFPWGNKFDPSFCNNSVAKSNSSGTTAVTQYEQVKSPYGTKDQSGNVWEWCLTDFDSGKREIENVNRCVVRGGSWYLALTDGFRVVGRGGLGVDDRDSYLGFRLARSLNQF